MPSILRIGRRVPLLLLLAALAAGAHAQTVYRSVMPDGKIVYGNKPEPGATEAKPMSLPPPNISAPTQPSSVPADAQSSAGNSNSAVATARQNLEAAKKALEDGREPLEDERSGIARKGGGGTTQLNEAYYRRIKSLEDAVAAAQNQLDVAQRTGR